MLVALSVDPALQLLFGLYLCLDQSRKPLLNQTLSISGLTLSIGCQALSIGQYSLRIDKASAYNNQVADSRGILLGLAFDTSKILVMHNQLLFLTSLDFGRVLQGVVDVAELLFRCHGSLASRKNRPFPSPDATFGSRTS